MDPDIKFIYICVCGLGIYVYRERNEATKASILVLKRFLKIVVMQLSFSPFQNNNIKIRRCIYILRASFHNKIYSVSHCSCF